jgi:hypothetical protein
MWAERYLGGKIALIVDNRRFVIGQRRLNSHLINEVKRYFKWTVTRRNIKGRPFWSRVLSVRLKPTTERNALHG